ncbi:MAG: hypothetical protein MN733_10900, partial [Nitrososphaera sp.]|nr:hypothetical protein [Nitrososphaera sp.]
MNRRSSLLLNGIVAHALVTCLIVVLGCSFIASGSSAQASDASTSNCTSDPGQPRILTKLDWESNCVRSPSEVRISNDGAIVAYVYKDQIYVMPSDGGGPALDLTSPDYTSWSPVWSQDDKWLYFLSSPNPFQYSTTQIWKVSINGDRWPGKVTDIDGGVDSINLSHDKTRLLFVKTREQAGNEIPIEITDLVFKKDAFGYLNKEYTSHIHSLEISQDTTTEVTANQNHYDSEPIWSPSGNRIAFIREYRGQPKILSDLWITSIDASGAENLTGMPARPAERRSPAWSPNGKFIAYLWKDLELGPYAVTQLAILTLVNKEETILTDKLDRTVKFFKISPNSRFIYVVYANRGGQHLARIQLSDLQIERLVEGEVLVSDFDV